MPGARGIAIPAWRGLTLAGEEIVQLEYGHTRAHRIASALGFPCPRAPTLRPAAARTRKGTTIAVRVW